MTDLLTNAQMRAVEGAAIALGRVSGLELMERAGAGVVAAVFATWPALRGNAQRAVVLCGPGIMAGMGMLWRGCCAFGGGRFLSTPQRRAAQMRRVKRRLG